MSNINIRFKEARKRLHYSQKEYSKELGISQSHISGIENGKDNPSISLIKLACLKFGINEEWLLSGIGEMFVIEKEWGEATKEDIISKYEVMKSLLDSYIYNINNDSLLDVINAFSYFVSIISSKGLDDNKKEEFLNSFSSMMDKTEKTIFMTYMLKEIQPTNYKSILKYRTELDEMNKNRSSDFKNMLFIYLEQYNIDLEL